MVYGTQWHPEKAIYAKFYKEPGWVQNLKAQAIARDYFSIFMQTANCINKDSTYITDTKETTFDKYSLWKLALETRSKAIIDGNTSSEVGMLIPAKNIEVRNKIVSIKYLTLSKNEFDRVFVVTYKPKN